MPEERVEGDRGGGGGAEEGGMGRSSGEYVVRYIIIIVQNTLIVCLVVGATDYMPTTKHDPDKEGRQGCVGTAAAV